MDQIHGLYLSGGELLLLSFPWLFIAAISGFIAYSFWSEGPRHDCDGIVTGKRHRPPRRRSAEEWILKIEYDGKGGEHYVSEELYT